MAYTHFMTHLLTIRDSDFGFDTPTPTEYRERQAARAIVFDTDGKIALLHATVKGYHKLPGGGIEEGETPEGALKRECLEEIGCAVRDIQELATAEEFRNQISLHQISHCFLARLDGEKGTPQLEPDEIEEGFQTVWMTLGDAIQTIESEVSNPNYLSRFMTTRDLAFLEKAKVLLL